MALPLVSERCSCHREARQAHPDCNEEIQSLSRGQLLGQEVCFSVQPALGGPQEKLPVRTSMTVKPLKALNQLSLGRSPGEEARKHLAHETGEFLTQRTRSDPERSA